MSRKQRNRVPQRRRLQLESLERREVLAGNVMASVVGTTLMLTGDAQDNNVAVVALGNNRFAVSGLDTTINGSRNVYAPNKPVLNIVANLNNGNDNLGLTNNAQGLYDLAFNAGINLETVLGVTAAAMQDQINLLTNVTTFSLAGSLTATGGAGNDMIGVVGNLGGSISANLGPANANGGFNAFGIDGSAAAGGVGTVGGSISVLGADQADVAIVESTTVRGSVTASLGNGDNAVEIVDAAIGGSVAVMTLAGSDFVFVDDSTVAGSVLASLGNATGGSDEFNGYDSSIGALTVTTGSGEDFIDTANLVVQTNATISTGAGIDDIYTHEHGNGGTDVVGLLSINAGEGSNTVEVSGDLGSLSILGGSSADEVVIYDTTVAYNTTINTGAGDDEVTFDAVAIAYSLSVLLGNGANSLDVTGLTAMTVTLVGGEGVDIVTIDDADVGTFVAVMGSGNDVLTITNSAANLASLNGGLGDDTLNVDQTTLNNVDAYFAVLFETENLI
ncbi:MAG: hypothetical protein U0939_04665 [Pirellulales bacterium]